MRKFWTCAGVVAFGLSIELAGSSGAFARGGGSNIMNSPGYQRRLRESRGYVTNQSGSLFSPGPAAQPTPAPVHRHRKWRHRR